MQIQCEYMWCENTAVTDIEDYRYGEFLSVCEQHKKNGIEV